VVTADSALHTKQTSRGELREIVQACARWPGIQRARDVVEFCDGRSESVFESISRVVFREHRLPPPELQVWVGGDDQVAGRVDFLWRKYRTVAEADGAAKYSDPTRARMQLQRDARLREAGFEVVHFGWQELQLAPGQVTDSIRAAFARGGAS
jgi:very-short-patch-repair endonuclease